MGTQPQTDVIETISLDKVRPYWRNPRRVTEDAVNQLIASIREYGYQQPIVVDSDYVIIVGHTRYAALRRMEVSEAPVRVARSLTPAQAKQYRVLDNRAGEFSSWKYDELNAELAELDSQMVSALFFDEPSSPVGDIDPAQGKLAQETSDMWQKVDMSVDFICPSCFHSWEASVTREDILAGHIPAPTPTSTTEEIA